MRKKLEALIPGAMLTWGWYLGGGAGPARFGWLARVGYLEEFLGRGEAAIRRAREVGGIAVSQLGDRLRAWDMGGGEWTPSEEGLRHYGAEADRLGLLRGDAGDEESRWIAHRATVREMVANPALGTWRGSC